MRFLVVSDIHAVSSELVQADRYFGSPGSDFHIEDREKSKNRIFAIENCLSTWPKKVDALLCLGDMAHQSKQLPLMQVWNDIHELARRLDIRDVFAVTGNHDVGSRSDTLASVQNRLEFLKSITPQFPNSDCDFYKSYFLEGVASRSLERCELIAIDTCSTHGLGGSEASKIWQIGSLTERMIEQVIERVEASSHQHVLIMMHHHPLKVDEILDPDYDQLDSGANFVSRLSSTTKKIFVMHGHKHLVGLRSHAMSTSNPIIFSSASLAARPYEGQHNGFYNQFHLIDFDFDVTSHVEGSIFSWDWGASQWNKSSSKRMPHEQAFGMEVDVNRVVNELESVQFQGFLPRDKLLMQVPMLKFCNPKQIDDINDRLEDLGRAIVVKREKISGLIYEESR